MTVMEQPESRMMGMSSDVMRVDVGINRVLQDLKVVALD
jgi:hypothetical protein